MQLGTNFLLAVVAEQALPDLLDFMDTKSLMVTMHLQAAIPVGQVEGARLTGGNPNHMIPVVKVYSCAVDSKHQFYRDEFEKYIKKIIAKRGSVSGKILPFTPDQARDGGILLN